MEAMTNMVVLLCSKLKNIPSQKPLGRLNYDIVEMLVK